MDVWGRLLACVCERGGHLRVAGYGVKNVDRGAISIKITGIYKHRYIGILPIHPPLTRVKQSTLPPSARPPALFK